MTDAPASPPAASPAPGGGATPPKAQQGAQPAGAQAPPNVVAQQAPPGEPGNEGLTPDEERQLGELLDKRDRAGTDTVVRLRVEGDHSSVQVGHVVVGTDWTDVPEHLVAAVTEGAELAGVQVTQEESE